MTLVLAWTDTKASYLVADTSTTYRGSDPPFQLPISSLGQRQKADDGSAVVEDVQKIINLGRGFAAGLVGDAPRATEFAQLCETNIRFGMHLEQAIARASDNFETAGFAIAITGFRDGSPQTWAYDGAARTLHTLKPMAIALFGSLSGTEAGERLVEFVKMGHGFEPKVRLVNALAQANSLGIFRDLVKDFVCGCFVGAWTDASGLHWQDDLLFLVYRPDIGSVPRTRDLSKPAPVSSGPVRAIELIGTRFREDRVIVQSTMSNTIRVLRNPVRRTDAEWGTRNEAALAPEAAGTYAYAIFLPMIAEGRVLVCERVDHVAPFFAIRGEDVLIRNDLVTLLSTNPNESTPRYVFMDATAIQAQP